MGYQELVKFYEHFEKPLALGQEIRFLKQAGIYRVVIYRRDEDGKMILAAVHIGGELAIAMEVAATAAANLLPLLPGVQDI